jgi:MFS family permease
VTADAATLVILAVVAYTEGGVAAVGFAAAARILPRAIAGPWAALVTDRYPRARVIALAHGVCMLQLLALSGVVALHLPLLVVYGLVVFGSVLSAVVKPASCALVPQLVAERQELTGANALYCTMEGAGTLLGPALAGVLVGVFGPSFAFAAIALLSTTGLIVSLAIRSPAPSRAVPRRGTGWGLGEMAAGVESLLDARVRDVFILVSAQTGMRGFLNVFVVAAAISLLDLGEAGSGGLFSMIGLGGLVGSFLSFRIVTSRRLALPFACGVAAWGCAVLAIAAWPSPLVAWVVLAGLGLGNAIEDVAAWTVLQREIADDRLGRALGLLQSAAEACMAVGSLAAPLLIATLGLRGAMALSGAALVLLVLVRWSGVRKTDQAAASTAPCEPLNQRWMRVRGLLPSLNRVAPVAQPTDRSNDPEDRSTETTFVQRGNTTGGLAPLSGCALLH